MSKNKRKRSLAVVPELLKKQKNQGILVPVKLQLTYKRIAVA
jgi:hypothetical protein